MKKIFGVGVGPGDKEYITLKGYNLIRKADVVFIPKSCGKSTAGNIAEDYIKDKRVLEINFPMGEDNLERYKEAAAFIDSEVKDNEIGVFLTIGDPMVYSTFLYLMFELEKRNICTESIPGITSFCAVANKVRIPLTLKGDRFYLCDGEIDKNSLKSCDSISILKTYKNKDSIISMLEEEGFDYVYIEKCTCKDEKIIYDKSEILKSEDYMSLILGRRKNND